MTKKNTGIKIFVLAFCALIFTLMTGCANMSTQIELNGEKFSGERVMTISFDMDELLTRLPSGVDDLNEQIDAVIPKQLTYKYEVNDEQAEYKFTLAFDSKQDYIDQLKDLLNKAPEVKFTYSTGVFTRGVTYSENFESRELFSWFDKLITENGLVSSAQNYSSEKFWNQTGVKINLDGEEYSCEGGKVDIESGGKSVVSSMTISTVLKESGDIERTIMIVIPKSTEESQITLIENYLNDTIPDSGRWSKRTRSNNTIYTIQFTAGSAAKLQNYMERLTSGTCECSIENVQDLSQPLADSHVLSEYIDFSYFGGESAVPVTYEISSETDSEPYQINLDDGEQEKTSDATTDGSKLVCSGNFKSIKFKTVLRNTAKVRSIEYNLIQNGSNKFMREIVIILEDGTDPSVLDNIADYYNVKGAGNTNIVIENDEQPIVRIQIVGNAKQVVAAEAVLFGGVGARALGYDSDWGIFTLHPETTLIDSFDITSLITLTGVSKVAYSYYYDGNIVTDYTGYSNGEQSSENPENEKESSYIRFGLSNGIQTITINGYYFNGWAIFFYILTGLIIFALIAMSILLYLYKTGKIDLPVKKKSEIPTEPESSYRPIIAPPPVQEAIPIPMPAPSEPVSEPAPLPRDFTDTFDDDEPTSTPIMLFDMPKDEEPELNFEPVPITSFVNSEPNMEPVISYPEKYHPTDEFASKPELESIDIPTEPIQVEPVVQFDIPAEPIQPEPTVQFDIPASPIQTEPRETPKDYTDSDMIKDFDALGLLGEYKRHMQKVKVKVRKQKNSDK